MSHASGVCRVNSSCARSLFMNPRVRGLLKWRTFPMEWIIIIILLINSDTQLFVVHPGQIFQFQGDV
jgi:hypothetical protein